MSGFVPPCPAPMRDRSGWRAWLMLPAKFLRARRCSIAALTQRSYSMHLGATGLPHKQFHLANQPALVQRILVDEAADFPKSDLSLDMLEVLIGNSVFVSNGETWKRQRAMMDPAFEHARIKTVFGMMLAAADDCLARLDGETGRPHVQIDAAMMHVTADIIFRTLFSRPFSADEARTIHATFARFQDEALAYGMARAIGLPDLLSWAGKRRAKKAAADIRAILDGAILPRYERFHRGETQSHDDILQALVSVKDPQTDTHFAYAELCEQIAMLFLAGHETSASALSFAIYLIAMDQDVQARMSVEVREVLGDRKPAFADIKRLAYTRDVFDETLRLYPPVAFLPRTAARTCPMRDKTVRKGAMVTVSPWLMQRHRRLWSEPDVFDPARFADPATAEARRTAYLPFSKGPRVCLGASFALQEAVLVLAMLVQRYRIEPVPGFVPEPAARVTLRSKNGVKVRLVRRDIAGAG